MSATGETPSGAATMLEDEELDAVALESTRTIDIDWFNQHLCRRWDQRFESAFLPAASPLRT
jgi:hypothetical protein